MEYLKSRLLNSALALSLLLHLLALPMDETYAMANRMRMEPRLSVAGLRTEYKEDPLGIDVTPRSLACRG